MAKKPRTPQDVTAAPRQRILIKRKKLVSDPRYIVRTTETNTTFYQMPERGHLIYALVGQIAMEWTSLEELLDVCIGVLANHEQAAITACITAQMTGHVPRCLTIKALAQWRGLTEIVRATERLQNGLFEVSELRNRAIHDRIFIELKQKAAFKDHRMAKKELIYGLHEFDQAKLDHTVELIRQHHRYCHQLLNLIREQVYEDVP